MDVNRPLHTPCRRGGYQASCQSYGVCASTRLSRPLSCTGSNNLLSVGLIGVVPWESKEKRGPCLVLLAIVEHAESDVFMRHTIIQSDFDNCLHPDAVPLCLLVLEGYQISELFKGIPVVGMHVVDGWRCNRTTPAMKPKPSLARLIIFLPCPPGPGRWLMNPGPSFLSRLACSVLHASISQHSRWLLSVEAHLHSIDFRKVTGSGRRKDTR